MSNLDLFSFDDDGEDVIFPEDLSEVKDETENKQDETKTSELIQHRNCFNCTRYNSAKGEMLCFNKPISHIIDMFGKNFETRLAINCNSFNPKSIVTDTLTTEDKINNIYTKVTELENTIQQLNSLVQNQNNYLNDIRSAVVNTCYEIGDLDKNSKPHRLLNFLKKIFV